MWGWLCENTQLANGRVVECGWDPNIHTFIPNNKKHYTEEGEWKEGGWVLHRTREDRTTPNDVNVVEKVKASIKDAISIDDVEVALSAVKSLSRGQDTVKRPKFS